MLLRCATLILLTAVTATDGLAQESIIKYLDPSCIAKKATRCIDELHTGYPSEDSCRSIGGYLSGDRKICKSTTRSEARFASDCEAKARIDMAEGPDSCIRSISSTDAILTFLRQEYLAGLKAVLEEARDARVVK